MAGSTVTTVLPKAVVPKTTIAQAPRTKTIVPISSHVQQLPPDVIVQPPVAKPAQLTRTLPGADNVTPTAQVGKATTHGVNGMNGTSATGTAPRTIYY